MPLKEWSGNSVQARLTGTLTAGNMVSFSVDTATGFPSGATAPFVVTIDRGLASEEKILVTSRTGTTFSGLVRGHDDTADTQHSAQAIVEHTLDAATIAEANQHANNVPADPHGQYLLEADFQATFDTAFAGAVPDLAYVIPHTWAIGADVRVPSGDTDFIPPMFIPVPAGYQVSLTRARHRINSGTSATVKLQKNGVDITGWTGISVTTTATTTDAADSTFADGDMLALVVTAVSGTPRNLSFSALLEYKKL